jgi:hypothetical protein
MFLTATNIKFMRLQEVTPCSFVDINTRTCTRSYVYVCRQLSPVPQQSLVESRNRTESSLRNQKLQNNGKKEISL